MEKVKVVQCKRFSQIIMLTCIICLFLCVSCKENVVQVPKEYCPELVKLAEEGNPEAQSHLALCYANGEGVLQNETEAFKWWQKAAEQGNITAQRSLGACYFDGIGVNKNYSEAIKWFRKAAEQGDAIAISVLKDLGVLY